MGNRLFAKTGATAARLVLGLAAFAVWVAGAEEPDFDQKRYRFEFSASFEAGSDTARAQIRVRQTRRRVRELSFEMPAAKYSEPSADTELVQKQDRWIWRPTAAGGLLTYNVKIASIRGGRPDAMITKDWMIMRLEDLFPTARARAAKSAEGDGLLQLSGPAKWSLETVYGDVKRKWKRLENGDRIYPQPKGWLIGGELGIRRERIADRRVVIAAPKSAGLRRTEMLSFLHWTLPVVTSILPDFPSRLLIVGAPRPMWRGALSAPGSLYLHVDRPLVSENGTSTVVHELMHIAGLHSAAAGADWIVEGLAEFYALEILVRSNGLTKTRKKRVLRDLQDWVEREQGALRDPSKGADTARAVLLFSALDAELRAAGASLDAVVRQLASTRISRDALLAAARQALGRDSEVLARELTR